MTLLLEKIRKINRLLQKNEKVSYPDVARLMSKLIDSNVFIVSRNGEILANVFSSAFTCNTKTKKKISNNTLPEDYLEWIIRIPETLPNATTQTVKTSFLNDTPCDFVGEFSTIIPIYGGGERIATLIVARDKIFFDEADLLLSEYGATIVGMEILRERTQKISEEVRKKTTVRVAIATLSYSEKEAVIHILEELSGNEGLLVASKIADRVGITRSVIVNALRKFGSAGVIQSKSLGMKGTYIKVLNDQLFEEIKN